MSRVVLVLVVALGGGCGIPVGHLGFVTTRPLDESLPRRPTAAARRVDGRACMPLVVVFPAGRLPNLGDAIDHALDTGQGTVLFDATVYYEIAYLPLLGWRTCYAVEGLVE